MQDPKLQTQASRPMLIALLMVYSNVRLVAYERNKYGYIDEEGKLGLNGPHPSTVLALCKRGLFRRLDQSRIFRYEYGLTPAGRELAEEHLALAWWTMGVAKREQLLKRIEDKEGLPGAVDSGDEEGGEDAQ